MVLGLPDPVPFPTFTRIAQFPAQVSTAGGFYFLYFQLFHLFNLEKKVYDTKLKTDNPDADWYVSSLIYDFLLTYYILKFSYLWTID